MLKLYKKEENKSKTKPKKKKKKKGSGRVGRKKNRTKE